MTSSAFGGGFSRAASRGSHPFVSRGIPLVGVAIGLVGCDEAPPDPLANVVGDTGTARDTGGRDTGNADIDAGTDTDASGAADTGMTSDTSGSTDTGGSDTGGSTDTGSSSDVGTLPDTDVPDALSSEVAALLARFCSVAADCYDASYPYSAEDCEASTAESLLTYAEYGAGCYAAAIAYIDALSRGECVIEEYDGYEYAELRSNDVDLVGFAAACADATPEDIAIATAYCDTYVSCYGDSYSTPDECIAEVLWAAAEYDEALDYYACVAGAECVGGYLDHDCYEY